MRLTETLALLVCQTCGGAFTAADLQEAAYDDGYRDGLAERAPAARERRRP